MRFAKKQNEEEKISFPEAEEESFEEETIKEKPRGRPVTVKPQEVEADLTLQEMFDVCIGNLERTYLALVEIRKRMK